MEKYYVNIICHVFCNWEVAPPAYRAWVDNELFTERTWVWKDEYLIETLQLYVPIGLYQIKYELVPPFTGNIRVKRIEIEHGPPGSEVLKGNKVRIGYAST